MSHEPRPNLIFIYPDQWRGDCLSVLGHAGVDTPNLDAIGRQGVIFTAAYSTCPSCIATRASMFTGLTPNTHGRLGYQDQVPWTYPDMLAQLLSDAGYQTHCAGKTHFFPQRKHCGFHSVDSYEASQNHDGRYVNDYREWLRDQTNGEMREWDHGLDSNSWVARPSHLPERLHNNTWTMAKALDFIRRRDRTRPYFLNVAFHRPHPPIDPPQAYYDMFRDRSVPPVPVGDWALRYDVPVTHVAASHGHLPDAVLTHSRRAYYAQLAHLDNQIGRLQRAFRELNEPEPWIIFTSDHGEMLGDHHIFRKCVPYEGSAKIPLLIRPPGGRAGIVCDAPVAAEDIYPTILAMAGIAPPKQNQGLNLLPFCEGHKSRQWREFVHGEHTRARGREGMQFLTDGKRKYVWWTETGEEQLFDLEKDPQERHDLAKDKRHEKLVRPWREHLVKILAQRPEDQLSDGKKLLPGKNLPAVREWLLK